MDDYILNYSKKGVVLLMKKIVLSVIIGGVLVANTYTDVKTKLMWQDNIEAKTVQKDWQESMDYCENLTLSGFKNWRLPNHMELVGISDKTKISPAIKKGFKNVISDAYWSSSTLMNMHAWGVTFYDGDDNYDYDQTYKHYVRCVRDSK